MLEAIFSSHPPLEERIAYFEKAIQEDEQGKRLSPAA